MESSDSEASWAEAKIIGKARGTGVDNQQGEIEEQFTWKETEKSKRMQDLDEVRASDSWLIVKYWLSIIWDWG